MMNYIVRIVTEEAFRGLTTGYVGPFPDRDAAERYAASLADDPEIEAYVETLHTPESEG